MSETRLRIIVACGAAGGIAATFNAPITGLFFGFEIVLREFSLDALFATDPRRGHRLTWSAARSSARHRSSPASPTDSSSATTTPTC